MPQLLALEARLFGRTSPSIVMDRYDTRTLSLDGVIHALAPSRRYRVRRGKALDVDAFSDEPGNAFPAEAVDPVAAASE